MPFKPGQSGNPRGRTPEHVKAAKIRKLILAAAPDVVAAMIEQAKAGDSAAGRALLATVCPPIKPVELPARLPPLPDGLAARATALLDYTVTGLLSPSQGVALISALAAMSKILETDCLMTRMDAAEQEIRLMAQQPPVLPAPAPADSPIGEFSDFSEFPAPDPPEPAPEPPHTVIEIEAGESLADVAEALGIEAAELQNQIAAGLIVIRPAKDTTP